MAFGDQDLDIFFQDGTEVLCADGSSFMAHFDTPEKNDMFGTVRSIAGESLGKQAIRYATASAPANFGHGSVVTINGAKYKVRSPNKEGDGLVSVAELANP